MRRSLTAWNRIFSFGKKAAKKVGIKSEEEVNKIVQEFRKKRKNLRKI